MKAFVISLVLLGVVTVGAALTLGTIEQSSEDSFSAQDNVRL